MTNIDAKSYTLRSIATMAATTKNICVHIKTWPMPRLPSIFLYLSSSTCPKPTGANINSSDFMESFPSLLSSSMLSIAFSTDLAIYDLRLFLSDLVLQMCRCGRRSAHVPAMSSRHNHGSRQRVRETISLLLAVPTLRLQNKDHLETRSFCFYNVIWRPRHWSLCRFYYSTLWMIV